MIARYLLYRNGEANLPKNDVDLIQAADAYDTFIQMLDHMKEDKW